MSDTFIVFLVLPITDTCIKRWGLRASSLSAVAKADAGQKTSNNHLNPNVLYMMLYAEIFSFHVVKIINLFHAYIFYQYFLVVKNFMPPTQPSVFENLS
jgi:hypothetical protein